MKHTEESADSENEPWSKKLLNPRSRQPWMMTGSSPPKFRLSRVFDSDLSFEAHGKSFMVNRTMSTACPDLSSLNALDESLVFNSGTLGLSAQIPEVSRDLEFERGELGSESEQPAAKKKKKKNIFEKIQNTISSLFKRKKKSKKKGKGAKNSNKSKGKKKGKSSRKSWRAKSKGRKVNLNSCLDESFMTAKNEDTRNFEGVNFKGEEIFQNE